MAGSKTANSLEKEITFFVKVRNYLECNAPKWQWNGDSQSGWPSNPPTPMWRPRDSIQIWEEWDSAAVSNSAHMYNQFGLTKGNRINNLVNFGNTVKDWSNSYDNTGVWTVPANRDYQIDIDLKLQHALSIIPAMPLIDQNNPAPVKSNGGISGYITLYRLPASNTDWIPYGERILANGSSLYTPMTGIQQVSRTPFGIVYNQGASWGGHNFSSGSGGLMSGTGSMKAEKEFPSNFANEEMIPKVAFTYPTQMKVPRYWDGNTASGWVYDPTSHYGLANYGEFYSQMGSWWGLEGPVNFGNRINSFSGVKSNNQYNINVPSIALNQGDRLFVVISALFAQFADNTNGASINRPINNDKRPGGILYQWNGSGSGANKKNQPTPAIGYLILQDGSFNTKAIL